MPQLAPVSALLLFLLYCYLFLIMIIMSYYLFPPGAPSHSFKRYDPPVMTWKW